MNIAHCGESHGRRSDACANRPTELSCPSPCLQRPPLVRLQRPPAQPARAPRETPPCPSLSRSRFPTRPPHMGPPKSFLQKHHPTLPPCIPSNVIKIRQSAPSYRLILPSFSFSEEKHIEESLSRRSQKVHIPEQKLSFYVHNYLFFSSHIRSPPGS